MDSLLSQDIGFFDVTKTGDITSRLSSDTTLVGDQVSLNVNVFLRSLVQAIGVLLFMFYFLRIMPSPLPYESRHGYVHTSHSDKYS